MLRTIPISVITISDNGNGFPENEIKFVFDKFYRLPPHPIRRQWFGFVYCQRFYWSTQWANKVGEQYWRSVNSPSRFLPKHLSSIIWKMIKPEIPHHWRWTPNQKVAGNKLREQRLQSLAGSNRQGRHYLGCQPSPELILLDIGLPDKNGHDILKELRIWYNKAILILSVQNRKRISSPHWIMAPPIISQSLFAPANF